MKKVLMVIAPVNFRDEEYFHTKEELVKAGIQIVTTSLEKVAVSQVDQREVKVDVLLEKVNPKEYDAVIFVGGAGASCYFNNKKALDIAKAAYQQGKLTTAICIAPSILANAGILKGKAATSWPSEKANLIDKGARYTGEAVTEDTTIITANGPPAAHEFGRRIAERMLHS